MFFGSVAAARYSLPLDVINRCAIHAALIVLDIDIVDLADDFLGATLRQRRWFKGNFDDINSTLGRLTNA